MEARSFAPCVTSGGVVPANREPGVVLGFHPAPWATTPTGHFSVRSLGITFARYHHPVKVKGSKVDLFDFLFVNIDT